MAEYSAQFTFTTPAHTITLGFALTGQVYMVDPERCSGLDQAGLRTPTDDKPQTDGADVFPRKRKARYPFFAGWLLNRTGTKTALNVMEDNLREAVESIEGATGTLAWTPTGGSSRTLTVYSEIPLEITGTSVQKLYSFGLIAPDPVWT